MGRCCFLHMHVNQSIMHVLALFASSAVAHLCHKTEIFTKILNSHGKKSILECFAFPLMLKVVY